MAGTGSTSPLISALLTIEGERHTIALQGISPCVDEIVADYLIDLVVPAAGMRGSL